MKHYQPQWVSKYRETKKAYDNETKDECHLVIQFHGYIDVWWCEDRETMEDYFVIVPRIGHNIRCLNWKNMLDCLRRLGHDQYRVDVLLPQDIDYKASKLPIGYFNVMIAED